MSSRIGNPPTKERRGAAEREKHNLPITDSKRLAPASGDRIVKTWSMDDEAIAVPDAETLTRQARSLIKNYLASRDIQI